MDKKPPPLPSFMSAIAAVNVKEYVLEQNKFWQRWRC